MAAKLNVNFFVLLRVALSEYYRSPYWRKQQRKLCWYVKFSQWKGEFWIQEVIRARLDTYLRLSSIAEEHDEAVLRRCKLRKTGE